MVRYWKWLIGNKDHFALEARVFNATCIALITCVLLYTPISYFMLTIELFFILAGMAFLVGILYYLSRFKGLSRLSATLFQIALNIALVINYYYNSGIDGPNHIIFLVAFFISAATAPIKQYYIWLPVNILLLSGIMIIEYQNPNFIELTYSDITSRSIDIFSSYFGIVVFIFIVTMFVRKSYNRQREELIAKSIALEEANNTKNKLLSILGHDLKEPLASLQGYLELLADFELDEYEQKEMNAQLLSMTRNTSFMLSNILAWTRAQEQGLSADLQRLGVKEVLTHVVELARSISLKKDISFEIDLPRHIYVKADAQMLALVVRNLLMNAIKFTRKGGNVWITAITEANKCIIVVKDDGIGIPDAMQTKIFRMESGSRRGTDSEKGTGLGLVLCQEFAEKMGGQLSFTSRADKGTTFSLTLPAAQMPASFLRKDNEADNEALEHYRYHHSVSQS